MLLYFFEARNAANAGTRNEEKENLRQKKEVIAELEKLAEEAGDGIQKKMQELIEKFNAIGFVPFRDKDKIYDEYHAALDKVHKLLKADIELVKQQLKEID